VRLSLFIILVMNACVFACSDTKIVSPPKERDTDSDTTSDSDSETDDIKPDAGEDETPPDLPSDCSAYDGGVNVSFYSEGDCNTPTVAKGNKILAAWAGDLKKNEYPKWHIQLTVYDPSTTKVTATAPMAETALAEKPSIAYGNETFGMVWLDVQWDPSCKPALLKSCRRDVAFMRFDETGTPMNTTPVQLTNVDNIKQRPNIAATSDGWIVVWQEQVGSQKGTVRAMTVSLDGTPGTAFDVSYHGGSDSEFSAKLASLGDTAIAIWTAYGQTKIEARKLKKEGIATGDVIVIDKDVSFTLRPDIVAGAGEYLVSMERKVSNDFEIYTVLLDKDGKIKSTFNRATWTTSDASQSTLAWNGTNYALAWLSDRNNGDTKPIYDTGSDQVFIALLDSAGKPATSAVMISDDPNIANNIITTWDGSGWTTFWQLAGASRERIFRGRISCNE